MIVVCRRLFLFVVSIFVCLCNVVTALKFVSINASQDTARTHRNARASINYK